MDLMTIGKKRAKVHDHGGAGRQEFLFQSESHFNRATTRRLSEQRFMDILGTIGRRKVTSEGAPSCHLQCR
jgi:hypothetical protein